MARGVDSCAPTDDELTAMKKAGFKYKAGEDAKIQKEIQKIVERTSKIES
jgi:hypothetical protein